MFGFHDSSGMSDMPRAVAEISLAEEQLTAIQQLTATKSGRESSSQAFVTAMLVRLKFRRNLLNVSPLKHFLASPAYGIRKYEWPLAGDISE